MNTDYATFRKEDLLDCSKNSPRYHMVLGFYLGLIETTLHLMDTDSDLAKSTFSQVITEHMPEHQGLINKIDYMQLLSGEYAEDIAHVYEAMLDIWMDIQEESLPHTPALNHKKLTSRLLAIHSRLVELYQLATVS